MAYRNTFFRWLFLYSLTFGLTYVLKLFTYLCPETGQVFHHFHAPEQGGKGEVAFSLRRLCRRSLASPFPPIVPHRTINYALYFRYLCYIMYV